jgi:two-component system response regulator MtrA
MERRLALIVEDEPDLQEIFAAALQAAGFDTKVAGRGDVALECLESLVPDIILLDLHLPGVDGADVLRGIKANERLNDTRVIVASADASFAEMLEVDVDLTLLKPISFTQLRDLVSRF